MMISKFDNLSNIDVDAFICKYNIVLDIDYISFLVKYNGGFTPKTTFSSKKISSDVKGFFGINTEKMNIENLELREWVKFGCIPIAEDSFGHYCAIGIQPEDNAIYFVDHELGKSKIEISNSFRTFVDRCKSKRIKEASTKSVEERERDLISKGRGSIITDELRQLWINEIEKYKNLTQEDVVI